MKRELCVFAAGACSGGAAVYFRARYMGALKVLFGRAEAIASADALKLKALAEAEAAKLMAAKAQDDAAGAPKA